MDNQLQHTTGLAPTAHPKLDIIYHDQNFIAINKSAGLLVHRSYIDFHETSNAVDLLQAQIQQPVYPVHRLDKPTSGVLLFALDKQSAGLMSELFRNHQITKHYLAVVRGHADLQGTVDNPVRDKDAPQKPRKDASTSYRALAHLELGIAVDRYASARYSLLEVQPLSGRRHQIRQHMKHISHPLIGDTSYGKSIHNKFFKSHFECTRLLLHAQRLNFIHPVTLKQCDIEASKLDDQFRHVLAHSDWQYLECA